MNDMYELKEMLEDELNKITKQGKITTGILDTVDKLTHAIKSIETTMAMREGGYSNRSYGRGSYGYSNRGRSYDDMSHDGYSGRIRQDGYRDQRYNYSRDGYSRDLKQDLEHLMHKADTEEEHRMLKKWINELDG